MAVFDYYYGRCDDLMVPYESRRTIVGNLITIDLGGVGRAGVGLPVAWARTEQIGTLAPGTYQVFGSVYGGTFDPFGLLLRGPELMTTFTVTPEPGSLLILAFGGLAMLRRRGCC